MCGERFSDKGHSNTDKNKSELGNEMSYVPLLNKIYHPEIYEYMLQHTTSHLTGQMDEFRFVSIYSFYSRSKWYIALQTIDPKFPLRTLRGY